MSRCSVCWPKSQEFVDQFSGKQNTMLRNYVFWINQRTTNSPQILPNYPHPPETVSKNQCTLPSQTIKSKFPKVSQVFAFGVVLSGNSSPPLISEMEVMFLCACWSCYIILIVNGYNNMRDAFLALEKENLLPESPSALNNWGIIIAKEINKELLIGW